MTRFLLLYLIALLFSPIVFAVENPWDTRLPIESGLISYKSSGNLQGKKALYFKDYGRTRAEYEKTVTKLMGMTHIESTITLTTPDWIYTIDKQTRTGTKEINPNRYLISEFNRLSEDDQKKIVATLNKKGKMGIEGMEGKIERNKTRILGLNCDRITLMGSEVYVISGTDIPLKTTGNAMGIKVEETATSVKQGIPPAKAFSLPKIHYEPPTESEMELQQQAREVIQSILEDRPLQISGFDDADQDDISMDNTDFEFGDDISDEQAIRFRQQQSNNTRDIDENTPDNNQETAEQIQRGLTKMFKNMF